LAQDEINIFSTKLQNYIDYFNYTIIIYYIYIIIVLKMTYPKWHIHNKISDIRNTSSFYNYGPQSKEAENLVNWLKRLASNIVSQVNDNWKIEVDWARLIWISGACWLWKTHLAEAFITEIIDNINNEQKDWIYNNIILCRDFGFLYTNNFLKDYKIVILDDLFSKFQSLSWKYNLSNEWFMLWCFWDFILNAYETKQIVIISSNFTLEYISNSISVIDTIGRIKSRFWELLAWWKRDFVLTWDDYRLKKSEIESDPFSL
jgi:hypothetical protein